MHLSLWNLEEVEKSLFIGKCRKMFSNTCIRNIWGDSPEMKNLLHCWFNNPRKIFISVELFICWISPHRQIVCEIHLSSDTIFDILWERKNKKTYFSTILGGNPIKHWHSRTILFFVGFRIKYNPEVRWGGRMHYPKNINFTFSLTYFSFKRTLNKGSIS